jgi:hypothetical protein
MGGDARGIFKTRCVDHCTAKLLSIVSDAILFYAQGCAWRGGILRPCDPASCLRRGRLRWRAFVGSAIPVPSCSSEGVRKMWVGKVACGLIAKNGATQYRRHERGCSCADSSAKISRCLRRVMPMASATSVRGMTFCTFVLLPSQSHCLG